MKNIIMKSNHVRTMSETAVPKLTSTSSSNENADAGIDNLESCVREVQRFFIRPTHEKSTTADYKVISIAFEKLVSYLDNFMNPKSFINGEMKLLLNTLGRLCSVHHYIKKSFSGHVLSLSKVVHKNDSQALCVVWILTCIALATFDDEAFQLSILSQFEKLGTFSVLLQCTIDCSNGAVDLIYPSVLILDKFLYVLKRPSTFSSASLQGKLKAALAQPQTLDALFQLARHDCSSLSALSVGVLVQLLLMSDKSTCHTIQVGPHHTLPANTSYHCYLTSILVLFRDT